MTQLNFFDPPIPPSEPSAPAHEPLDDAPEEEDLLEIVDKELLAKWVLFDIQHPEVMELCRHFAHEALKNGERRISARGLWEQVRQALKLRSGIEKRYVMDNNYVPVAARMLIAENPDFGRVIELRRMKRKHKVVEP